MDISSYFSVYEKTFCAEQGKYLIHATASLPAESVCEIFIIIGTGESQHTGPDWITNSADGSTVLCADKIAVKVPYPEAGYGCYWQAFPTEAE